MDRRSFFKSLVGASTAVVVTPDMEYSDPDTLKACWSGWRTAQDNNRMSAWYTAHFPELLVYPDDGVPSGHQHFISIVTAPWSGDAPKVSGYYPGYTFDITNSPYLEDCPEAMYALTAAKRGEILDRVFAPRKELALKHLKEFIDKCHPVK